FSALSNEKFNVIATNPPYIKRDVISTLDEDVKYEPLLALDGGEDGLTIIKTIIKTAPLFLEKNGNLFMEIGYDQKEEVSTLFKENGFEKVDVIKDLGGRDRVVKGFLK
ncbi:MAG: peptide chain release factor N(5)-glutamine methyltransferase, partial [Sphaerochaetaceae bacterium]|nr:peptide chain release factor N(5)-glutamine methyltransferase [Sphaerochaetaceae bacterium]